MSNLLTYEEWRDWANDELHQSAGAWIAAVVEVKKLQAELAELRRDKARLDYMQRYAEAHNGHWIHVGDGGLVSKTDDIREAIDAVMEGGEG